MELDISRGTLQWTRPARQSLDRAVNGLRTRVQRCHLEPATLEARFEQLDGAIEAHLTLRLPHRVLSLRVIDEDLQNLVRVGFYDLFREFDRYRWRIDPTWRRRVAERKPRGRIDAESADSFRAEVARKGLPLLMRIARDEIAKRQIAGALAPGWVEPQDAVDDVLASHWLRLDPKKGLAHAVAQLHDALSTRLDEIVSETRDGTDISLDGEDPPPPVDLGDDLYDFWVPEEEIRVEDHLADVEAIDPIDVVEVREWRHAMTRALFDLPRKQRQLFEFCVVAGFSPETVSANGTVSPAEVRREVHIALAAVQKKLSPDGALDVDAIREMYAALGERHRDDIAPE